MKVNRNGKLGQWIIAIALLAQMSCQLASGPLSPATPGYAGQPPGPATPAPITDATVSPLPALAAGGLAGFRDQFAVADQFFVALADVSPLPLGQAYQG